MPTKWRMWKGLLRRRGSTNGPGLHRHEDSAPYQQDASALSRVTRESSRVIERLICALTSDSSSSSLPLSAALPGTGQFTPSGTIIGARPDQLEAARRDNAGYGAPDFAPAADC